MRRFAIPVIAVVCGIILAGRLPADIPFLTFAFCGTFVLFLFSRPNRVEVLATLSGAAVLSWIRLAIWRSGDAITHRLTLPGISLGLSTLLVIAASSAWCTTENRQARLKAMLIAAAIPFFVIISSIPIYLTARLHPLTYDGFLYAFDATLGFEPSFWIGELLLRARWLRDLSEITYNALPLLIAIVYAKRAKRDGNAAGLRLLLICGVAGAAGFLLYHLLPAAGPAYLYPAEFPRLVPPIPQLKTIALANPLAPRNAMPSLHFAWALLLWWNSRGLPAWVRALTGVALALTFLATLGSGEHYLVDLVVGVPFALAIQTACRPKTSPNAIRAWAFHENSTWRLEWLVFFLAGAIVFVWTGLLRFSLVLYQAHPATNWLMVLVTVASSLMLRHTTSDSQAARQPHLLGKLVRPEERA